MPTGPGRKRVYRIARISDGANVAVVANALHGQADGRIHHAAGDRCRVQGGSHEFDEQRRHRRRPPGVGVGAGQG